MISCELRGGYDLTCSVFVPPSMLVLQAMGQGWERATLTVPERAEAQVGGLDSLLRYRGQRCFSYNANLNMRQNS